MQSAKPSASRERSKGMNKEEAMEWLKGSRSMINIVPRDPYETWECRIAEADASMIQQAYWIVRASKEGLTDE